ncbi:MAG: porin family protein [Bacteroidota bacterium]
MRFSLSILFFFLSLSGIAQKEGIDFTAVDSLYREDQFYLSMTYSNLQNPYPGFNQNKISAGVSLGFLRDFPINKSRTWAIAAGLGYSYNGLNQNLGITEVNGKNEYSIITTGFSKNKLIFHYVDLPIEIRWRTSTPQSHKFWRIYTGFKVSYLFSDQYKFEGSDVTIKQNGNPDLNKLQYGTYIAAGWNTWNAYVYYGLNPIFKSATINSEPLKMNALNIGLMFYIL